MCIKRQFEKLKNRPKQNIKKKKKNAYQNNFNINQAGFETKCNTKKKKKKTWFLDNIPIVIIYPALFHIKMIKRFLRGYSKDFFFFLIIALIYCCSMPQPDHLYITTGGCTTCNMPN